MYNVALLIERELIDLDADQILSLHEGVEDDVTYHVLLPVQSSAAALSSSMTAFGGAQFMPVNEPSQFDAVEEQLREVGQTELDDSVALFTARGQTVTGTLADYDAIEALADLVKKNSCDEVIILTEPHVVQEFLRLDWASRARRKLEVPTLHLLEHYSFDEQTRL